jgi:uncharacterized membrane protein
MSNPSLSTPRLTRWASLRATLIAIAVTLTVIVLVFKGDLQALSVFFGRIFAAYDSVHLPDLAPLASAGPVIQAHVATVLAAFAIGTFLMLGVKGTILHRVLGWVWVIFMITTAAISFFIRDIANGGLSFIHIFSALVLIQAPLGVYFARAHRVSGHRQTMMGLYFGALLVAGFFTFLPGRIMYQVFFG